LRPCLKRVARTAASMRERVNAIVSAVVDIEPAPLSPLACSDRGSSANGRVFRWLPRKKCARCGPSCGFHNGRLCAFLLFAPQVANYRRRFLTLWSSSSANMRTIHSFECCAGPQVPNAISPTPIIPFRTSRIVFN
jgi:hypothetical protein